MPENFTERRCHLTPPHPPTSNASGLASNPLDCRPMIGFSATSRYLGCAVISGTQVVALHTLRVRSKRLTDAEETTCWAARFLESHCPSAVAFLDEGARGEGGVEDAQTESVHRAAARCNLAPTEVCRAEIALALGLDATTTVAIRLELARRFPMVAAHVSQARRRSESDRYWEPAILAAAAALAILPRSPLRP